MDRPVDRVDALDAALTIMIPTPDIGVTQEGQSVVIQMKNTLNQKAVDAILAQLGVKQKDIQVDDGGKTATYTIKLDKLPDTQGKVDAYIRTVQDKQLAMLKEVTGMEWKYDKEDKQYRTAEMTVAQLKGIYGLGSSKEFGYRTAYDALIGEDKDNKKVKLIGEAIDGNGSITRDGKQYGIDLRFSPGELSPERIKELQSSKKLIREALKTEEEGNLKRGIKELQEKGLSFNRPSGTSAEVAQTAARPGNTGLGVVPDKGQTEGRG